MSDSLAPSRKRSRSCNSESSSSSVNAKSDAAERVVPKGFYCPLTMDIMFEPVLDTEGNSYERSALLDWLKLHRTSPISRQPLSERMVVPNNALRDCIHEFMGSQWVAEKESQQPTERPRMHTTTSTSRGKIECFLQFASKNLGGLALTLNDRGCTAFRFDGITFVINVPMEGGMFCLYTRNLVMELTESMKDLLLEMNFSQGDTRGGCLSVKKNSDGQSEVMFSYTDRVAEICASDFNNILLNFLDTTLKLRQKLLQRSGQGSSSSKFAAVPNASTDSVPAADVVVDIADSSKAGNENISSTQSTGA